MLWLLAVCIQHAQEVQGESRSIAEPARRSRLGGRGASEAGPALPGLYSRACVLRIFEVRGAVEGAGENSPAWRWPALPGQAAGPEAGRRRGSPFEGAGRKYAPCYREQRLHVEYSQSITTLTRGAEVAAKTPSPPVERSSASSARARRTDAPTLVVVRASRSS